MVRILGHAPCRHNEEAELEGLFKDLMAQSDVKAGY